MKHITFIRHAKSDWDNSSSTKDIDRTLNERGRRVAPKMGMKLKELNLSPDHVVSSPSIRTRETVELVIEHLNFDLDTVEYIEELYEASTRNISNIINAFDEKFNDVVVIGHNPGLTYMCEYLTNEVLDNIPTCGVVRISFDISSWSMIVKGLGKLEYFIFPKQFEY